jgi:hypothetical protein
MKRAPTSRAPRLRKGDEAYYGTYQRLNVSVLATPRVVVRAASRKLTKQFRTSAADRGSRHEFYRIMLRLHRRSAHLYYQVARGF